MQSNNFIMLLWLYCGASITLILICKDKSNDIDIFYS